jgi:hypothetical protein
MVEWKPLVGGALAGTVFDLAIDFPLSSVGALYAWQFRDAQGRYVWGIGTGDILGAALGSGLVLVGKYALKGKRLSSALKDAGLGWLLALGCIKIAELYTYLGTVYPTTVVTFGSKWVPR